MGGATSVIEEARQMNLQRYEHLELFRTNILPPFTYGATTSKLLPTDIQGKLKRTIMSFLFGIDGKMQYEKVIQETNKGGLVLIDIPRITDLLLFKTCTTIPAKRRKDLRK